MSHECRSQSVNLPILSLLIPIYIYIYMCPTPCYDRASLSKSLLLKYLQQKVRTIGIKETCCIRTYALKMKADVKGCIENWLNTHLKLVPPATKPPCFQTGCYTMEFGCSYLAAQHGIKCRKTGTCSPQQTGFIERATAEVEYGYLTVTPQP